MKKLATYLSDKSKKEFAAKLGVSARVVDYWLHKHSLPNLLTAIKIERITKGQVDVYSWGK